MPEEHETFGHHVMEFLFKAPTEKDFGLATHKMSKEEALKAIHEAWEHPLTYQDPNKLKSSTTSTSSNAAVAHEDRPQRTLGEAMRQFFFEVPTGESLGLPKGKHVTKEEAVKALDEAWEHPFNHHHEDEKAHEEAQKDPRDAGPRKSFTEKLHDFFLEVPTEENLGLRGKSRATSR